MLSPSGGAAARVLPRTWRGSAARPPRLQKRSSSRVARRRSESDRPWTASMRLFSLFSREIARRPVVREDLGQCDVVPKNLTSWVPRGIVAALGAFAHGADDCARAGVRASAGAGDEHRADRAGGSGRRRRTDSTDRAAAVLRPALRGRCAIASSSERAFGEDLASHTLACRRSATGDQRGDDHEKLGSHRRADLHRAPPHFVAHGISPIARAATSVRRCS